MPLAPCRNNARGLFLDPPTVGTKAGAEVIFAPDGLWPKGQAPPATQEEREQLYSAHIRTRLQQHEASARCRVGACIIEPVLQVSSPPILSPAQGPSAVF